MVSVWSVCMCVCVCLCQSEHAGVHEMAVGGAIYISGIVFFKSDGVIPFAHAIWHCFVFLGALMHFSAVCHYLLNPGLHDSHVQLWTQFTSWLIACHPVVWLKCSIFVHPIWLAVMALSLNICMICLCVIACVRIHWTRVFLRTANVIHHLM